MMTTTSEIFSRGQMSVRSYNVCKKYCLNTIESLVRYYQANETFKDLDNCGEKSNKELIRICEGYSDSPIKDNPENTFEEEKARIQNAVSNLNRTQRQVINSFITLNIKSLSARSKNAVISVLQNDARVTSFYKNIFCNREFSVKVIKNVGIKSIPEIEVFIQIVKDCLFEVYETKDRHELLSLKNDFLIQKAFGIQQIPKEVTNSDSIFRIANFLILQKAFFDKSQNEVFIKTLNVFQNSPYLTLDEVGEMLSLTRERVRQIRNRCHDEILDKLSFVENFDDDLYQKYSIDINHNFIVISDEVLDNVNLDNKTNFSKQFATLIIYSYCPDRFLIVGNTEDTLIRKNFTARGRHNWRNIYLVKKEISYFFNFEGLIEDIHTRLQQKIDETYAFTFKSYLSNFLKTDDYSLINDVIQFSELLVYNEFNIIIDLDDNIIFKRTTIKSTYEYAYEALKSLGKPSKVSLILARVNEMYPELKTDENSIRSSMKRAQGFVPIGRRSVYGLEIWEKEFDNFKGGTIREIAQEYLEKHDVPKHIGEVTKYILQYRPKSNQTSILQNLKLETTGAFCFFKNSHVGLSQKKYTLSNKFIPLEDQKTAQSWKVRYGSLAAFVAKHERLPYSSGVPEEEQSLYRWYRIQKKKLKSGSLRPLQAESMKSLNTEKLPKSRRPRSNHSKELLEFVMTNNRPPSSKNSREYRLYQYMHRIVEQYRNGSLNGEDKSNLLTIFNHLNRL